MMQRLQLRFSHGCKSQALTAFFHLPCVLPAANSTGLLIMPVLIQPRYKRA